MNILVITAAGIGDTLFATPLIHELRLHFPNAAIDALVRWRGAKDLLEHNRHLNTVWQPNLLQAGGLQSLPFLWQLRKRRYDLSINTHPQSRMHYRILARAIGAPARLSHEYDNWSAFDSLLVNRTIPQNYEAHCIENNLALLELLNLKPALAQHDYELYLSPADQTWAEAYITAQKLAGRRLLGLHVGSGGTKNLALRRWPLANYLELIRRLNRACPEVAILLFGGPQEARDHEYLLAQTDPRQVMHPKTANLRQAAALVGKCSVFLSVDTNFMHLAAGMKVPHQFVIETPTWNKPIQPYKNPFVLIENPVVQGKNLEYYRYDGRGMKGTRQELLRCMASVTVDSVYEPVVEARNG